MTVSAVAAPVGTVVGVSMIGGGLAMTLWLIAGRRTVRDRVAPIPVVRLGEGSPRHRFSRFRPQRSTTAGAPLAKPSWLDASLRNADVAISARDAVRLMMIACSATGLLLGGLDARLGALAAVAVAASGPMVLFAMRGRGERRALEQLPVLLRSVASELRSGGTVATAFDVVDVNVAPLLAEDCARLRARISLGITLGEALEQWATERPFDAVRSTSGALTLAASVGGPSVDALEGLARSLAARTAALAETRAQSAQARASTLVMVLAPIGYLFISATIDQRSQDVLFGTGFGRACLMVGLLLDGLAALWIRYLVRDRFSG